MTKTGDEADLVLVTLPMDSAVQFYVQSIDLAIETPLPPIATPSQAVASPLPPPWQAVRPLGGVITCQIDGNSSVGHVALAATADNPGVVKLLLQKSTWRIPKGASVSVTMAFSDGTTLTLAGSGESNQIVFKMSDASALKTWVHGFTAGRTATIVFQSGNEPAWRLDLRGTSSAISAMAMCIKDNALPAPPPLGELSTQPFNTEEVRPPDPSPSPNAANTDSRAVPSVAPPPADAQRNSTSYGPQHIALLRLTYGQDLEKLLYSPAWQAPFVADGIFVSFERAPLPSAVWMVSVMTDPPTVSQVSCFYDHFDQAVASIAAGARVRG